MKKLDINSILKKFKGLKKTKFDLKKLKSLKAKRININLKKLKFDLKKINKTQIVYAVLLLTVLVCFLLIVSYKKPDIYSIYAPAPPEAPRLTSIDIEGDYVVKFDPETRYYEVEIPSGHPVIPSVNAESADDVNVEIYQALIPFDKTEGISRIWLDDGEYKNFYDVKFKKNKDQGFVLQYDDRYVLEPDYVLDDEEEFTFKIVGDSTHLFLDSKTGEVVVVGVSDTPTMINAYVGDDFIESFSITATEKAILDVFVVAGQGNAAGVGGNAEESPKALPGTAYVAEPNGDHMISLYDGREGFAPALASEWYGLTGEKVFVIQTALSDTSITQWTGNGTAYQKALNNVSRYMDELNKADSFYEVRKVFYFWLQGEWDITQKMTADEYIKHYLEMHENMKKDMGVQMGAIIPVRSVMAGNEVVEQIAPVCTAQFSLHNKYKDIRIITDVPIDASVSNGLVSADNLYYTQTGYNEIGKDTAVNLYNMFAPEVDRTVDHILVIGKNGTEKYEDGEDVEVKEGKATCFLPVAYPLYATNKEITAKFDSDKYKLTTDGYLDADIYNGLDTQLTFTAESVDFSLHLIKTKMQSEGNTKWGVYVWNFDDLNENEGKNNLTVSEKSTENGYTLENGVITLPNTRECDLSMEKSITFTVDKSWDIEWKGSLLDNGILLGSSFSTKSYIFLAPWMENLGYSIRLVDDFGKTVYLPYGDHAELNSQDNTWRINYNKENNKITLYSNGSEISSVEAEKGFCMTFTNLFGRYGNENVNYCFTGSLDYIKVISE